MSEPAANEAGAAPAMHFLATLDDEAFDEFANDLIAAYAEAQATGDGVREAELRRALTSVGRYLAAKLGPKACGVFLN